MAAQAQADDETIFAELQNLLIRHKYQCTCLYFTALTPTAWGGFLRVNLSRFSHCQCKIIYMYNYTLRNLHKMAITHDQKQKLQNSSCICVCVCVYWVCGCVCVWVFSDVYTYVCG